MKAVWTLVLLAPALAGCLSGEPLAEPTPTPSVDTTPFKAVWGDVAAAKLRPGAATNPATCTYNFLFVDPVNKTYFVGIAAHCTDKQGQKMGVEGHSKKIGEVVFDSDNGTRLEEGVENRVDFSLIRLYNESNLLAHPKMFNHEGPTGYIDCKDVKEGDPMGWYGHGMIFGETEPSRTRAGVVGSCDGSDYGAYTAAIFGDSGSGVLHLNTNKALGIVSRLGMFDTSPPTELTGATLPYIFRELAKSGFGDVALATVDGGYVAPPKPEPGSG